MITIIGLIFLKYLYGEKYYNEKLKGNEPVELLAGSVFIMEMLTVGFIGIIYKIHKWIKRS